MGAPQNFALLYRYSLLTNVKLYIKSWFTVTCYENSSTVSKISWPILSRLCHKPLFSCDIVEVGKANSVVERWSI